MTFDRWFNNLDLNEYLNIDIAMSFEKIAKEAYDVGVDHGENLGNENAWNDGYRAGTDETMMELKKDAEEDYNRGYKEGHLAGFTEKISINEVV